MSKSLYLSIHTLVDFLLRSGDIDSRVFNNSSMVEGTRIHIRYQKMQEGNYLSEVKLSGLIKYEEYDITLEGRADGIIIGGKRVIIDEIKSTVSNLDEFFESQGEWHLGQAICYAYLYALENNQLEMEVRLTYISQHDDSKMFKKYVYSFNDLEKYVLNLIKDYLTFYKRQEYYNELRNKSIINLDFPYAEFRTGQRDLSKFVYSVCKDGGELFFEAPTGTGKTISTLFPAIKTFPDGKNEKIFYLSAKNQTKEVAINAIDMMRKKGLFLRSILISSKEDMCQCDAKTCNPDECIFAKGYYTKLRKALNDLIDAEISDNKKILEYAVNNTMCPFELQLDYSLLCDVIVCDYNYLFDPLVHLKRYFDENNTPFFALVDEAHNLAERSLDMYSAEICEDDFLLLQKMFKKYKHPKFKKALKKVINAFLEYKIDEENLILDESDCYDMLSSLENYFKVSQDILKNYQDYISNQFIDCFRKVNRFLKIYEFYNDTFTIYFNKNISTLYLKCLDASSFLKNTISKIRGAVMFSATMTPLSYYIDRLGGTNDSPTMKLPSPFPKENLLLLVRGDISTRYKDRVNSYKSISNSIISLVKQKKGNYLVFFPSYQYMNDVINIFPNDDNINIIIQTKEMDKIQKDDFLNNFKSNPEKTTIGFAVLGGSFSEGIDLTNDKLIGAVIVGVGLPKISFERDIIKDYYNNKNESGFDYAYVNPGMNKVMQAAGRVIRTKDDVGVVLLLDERFLSRKYKELFKVEWSNYISVYSEKEIEAHASKFWNNH